MLNRFYPFLLFILFDVINNNNKTSVNSVLEIIVFSIFILFYSFINITYGYIICFLFVFYLIYKRINGEHSKENMSIRVDNNADAIIEKINNINLNEEVSEELIPKIIIQTGPNKMNPKYKSYVDLMKKKNPTFKCMYFNDDDIEVFLKKNYPNYYETYKKLPVFIQKIDFFRYIAVYHYGGFYFDLDIKMLKGIDEPLLNHSCIFPVDEYITYSFNIFDRYKSFFEKNNNFLLGQYAFASIPRHPFIKKLIDNIHKNIDSLVKNVDNTELYVYKSTGPDYVTNEYINYDSKTQIYIINNGKRQYFGDYAKHDYFGTWKKNKNN